MKLNKQVSLDRILGFFAILTITVSVFIQAILLAAILKKLSDSELLIFAKGYFFILIPGTILAFFGFIRHLSRSFKNMRSLIPASVYLLITLLPVALTIASAYEGRTPENSKPDNFVQTPLGVAREVTHSEQFKAGAAWAMNNLPTKASQCQGELEFIKGCRNYFFEHLQKPKPAGEGKYEGMTTAECQIEVNANFEALEREYIQNGNPEGAVVTRRRNWYPELQDCENYDRLAESKFFSRVYPKLEKLLERIKAGEILSPEEKADALKDFTDVSNVRNQPYKTAYLSKADELFQRMDGTFKETPTVYAHISCEEYQAKIDEMVKLDNERVAAMQALKREDGVVTDSARHSELNQQRIGMLANWKYYNDGAKAAGCEIRRDEKNGF